MTLMNVGLGGTVKFSEVVDCENVQSVPNVQPQNS